MTIVIIVLSALYCGVLIYTVYSVFALRSAAPFVPTGRRSIKKMLDLADVNKEDYVVDIGSGDGRMVEAAARRAAFAVGIEINPILHWIALCRKSIYGQRNTGFVREDLWKQDLSEANVVMMFFIKSKMSRLEKKLRRELKPGTRVVSHIFTFPGWQYTKKDGMLYLYIV